MAGRSWAQLERAHLCDVFETVGPDAPTLCGTWTTRDLAAHLILRESRPDANAGIVLKPLAGWTERVQSQIAQRPWPALVDTVRSGPPTLSPFRVPGVDSLLNTTEFYVHLEDVRRAQPDWQARELPTRFSDALWRIVKARGRAFFRHVDLGVKLIRIDGNDPALLVTQHNPVRITISGPAGEILLYAFGRKDHALVTIEGDDDALERLRAADMRV